MGFSWLSVLVGRTVKDGWSSLLRMEMTFGRQISMFIGQNTIEWTY